LIIQMMIHLVV